MPQEAQFSTDLYYIYLIYSNYYYYYWATVVRNRFTSVWSPRRHHHHDHYHHHHGAYLLIVEVENLGKRAEDDVTLAGQLLREVTVECLEVSVHQWRQIVNVLTLWLPQVLQRVPVSYPTIARSAFYPTFHTGGVQGAKTWVNPLPAIPPLLLILCVFTVNLQCLNTAEVLEGHPVYEKSRCKNSQKFTFGNLALPGETLATLVG